MSHDTIDLIIGSVLAALCLLATVLFVVFIVVIATSEDDGVIISGRIVSQTETSVTFETCEHHAKTSDYIVHQTYRWNERTGSEALLKRDYVRVKRVHFCR